MRQFSIFFVILVIFFTSSTLSKQDTEILLPDLKLNRTTKVLSNQIYIRFKKGIRNQKQLIEQLQQFGISSEKQLLNQMQSLRFASKKNKGAMLSAKQLNAVIHAEEPLLRTYRLSYSLALAPEIFCQRLLDRYPEIEIAEPVTVDEMLGTYIPNDKYVYQQGLLAHCKIFNLWEQWKGDTNTVIGISDGGIFQQHEDLINSIAPNWGEIPDDNIDNDGNGYVDDYLGYNLAYKLDGTKPGNTYQSDDHGSGVAGIACATTDNNLGIAGVAFNCRFFPIKTAKKWGTSIIYGYESIIYAAVRGVKVLNCSWGQPKRFSQIDQSIIDYAVSRNVAIVAAAGNKNGSLAPFYPASYRGVMSVGNVDLTDKIASSSSLGSYLDIMAPGMNSYVTTNNQGGYKMESMGGTSFASPVIAGVLALVRSKYPNLNPLEAIEFTRQMVDDIGAQNTALRRLLRGRINGFKVVNTKPMSIPGIVFEDKMLERNGNSISRLYKDEEAKLKVKCKNILGKANDLKFVLSMAYDFDQAIEVIDSNVTVQSFERNAELTIGEFKIKAKKDYNSLVIFRVDIYGDNNYHDFMMFPFIPTAEMTTFGNNVIQFSVGDRGQIGFFGSNEDIQGIGVNYKKFGNMIYNAGLMVTAMNGTKQFASAGIFGKFAPYTDFVAVKPFTAPDKFKGKLNDKVGVEFIGVEIEQIYNIPPDNNSIVTIDVTLKNISGKHYDNMAAGYYFDWDIMPESDSNGVALLPDAIPENMRSNAAAAEYAYFYKAGKSPFCGCAAYSDNTNLIAAASGMDYSTIRNFTLAEKYAALNTNTKIQFKEIADINMVVGMAFPGGVGNNQSRRFKFLFGCEDTKDALAKAFRDALSNTDVQTQNDNKLSIKIYPIPVEDKLNIVLGKVVRGTCLQYFDMKGNKVLSDNKLGADGTNALIIKDISNLSAGVYIVKLITGKSIVAKKFIKK